MRVFCDCVLFRVGCLTYPRVRLLGAAAGAVGKLIHVSQNKTQAFVVFGLCLFRRSCHLSTLRFFISFDWFLSSAFMITGF